MSGTVCFFSAIESQSHFDACVDAGVDRLLASYYALRKRNKNLLRDRARKNPKLKFFIDSGAHSFITDWEKFKDWKRDDFEKYIQGYVKWIRKNKSFIFCAVELDIDYCLNMVLTGDKNSTLGTAIVESWQRKYFQPLEKEGIPIVYVWHEERQLQGWEEMCQKFAYVGLPGELSKEKNFYQFRNIATKYSVKVHGFAASVTGDSVVYFEEKGRRYPIRIEDAFNKSGKLLEDSDGEQTRVLKNVKTWTLTDSLKSTYSPVKSVVRHKLRKKIYEITLVGGKKIRGTEDHSFFTLDNLGNLVEVTPESLNSGDFLVASKGFPESSQSTRISVEDALFYGIYFGDGYIHRDVNGTPRCVCISKQYQDDIRQECERFAHRYKSNWKQKIVPTTSTELLDGYMCSTKQASEISILFGNNAQDKFLGEAVLSMSNECQRAFLRGYFSTDGSAKGNNKNIELSCCKREPLEVVQLLLEQWDITSGISGPRLSGKGSWCWKLSIGDAVSRLNFLNEIGFLQNEQVDAIKSKGSIAAITKFRGLPTKLTLKEGEEFPPSRRHVKRTKVTDSLFCKKLRQMQCSILEIRSIEQVAYEETWVYDLCVPATERFFANGILAHNTKKIDYSEAGWYSVDSVTWKSGEMYGVFIDWDEKSETLLFIAKDRNKRHLYRQKIIDAGCDADGIIEDSDYKAITKWNLIQCNGVHMYYRKKYRNRIFPYDLRLPPLEVMQVASRRRVKFLSNKILFDKRFPKHAKASFAERRKQLCAISLVQHGDYIRLLVDDECLDFLKEYFPGLCNPLVKDMSIFQKEMSVFLLPRQQKAMSRGILPVDEHDKRPKPRTGDGFDLADLIDPAPEPELLKLL